MTLLLHYHIAFSLFFVCTCANTDLKFPFPLIIKNPQISKITKKREKTPISLIYETPKSPISQTLSLLFPKNLHTLDSTHENPSASPALHDWMWDWDSTNDLDPNESSASSISPYKQFKVKGIFFWNLITQGLRVCMNSATAGFSVRFRYYFRFYSLIQWISEFESDTHSMILNLHFQFYEFLNLNLNLIWLIFNLKWFFFPFYQFWFCWVCFS